MAEVFKDPRAVALCDSIRWLYNINKRSGWVARPRHGKKQIVVGHPDYHTDLDVSTQVDALVNTINHLGLAEEIGYSVCNLAEDF